MQTRRFVLGAVVATVTGFVGAAFAQEKSIVVASTTSTQDSGLFGYLLPLFKAKAGIDVKVVAQGITSLPATGATPKRSPRCCAISKRASASNASCSSATAAW